MQVNSGIFRKALSCLGRFSFALSNPSLINLINCKIAQKIIRASSCLRTFN